MDWDDRWGVLSTLMPGTFCGLATYRVDTGGMERNKELEEKSRSTSTRE